MRAMNIAPLVLAALVASACGDRPSSSATGAAANSNAANATGGAASPLASTMSTATAGKPSTTTGAGAGNAAPPPAVAAADGSTARNREALNPDNSTMVFLYFDLAGMKPPIDEWVENDNRVRFAQPADKAGKRAVVRAELESGMAAARNIGRIRVSLADASMSDYDPTYGEFTVRALGPSSELSYETLGQKVRTRFDNGQTAQLWKVPADQAQSVRDRIAQRRVQLDVVLKVTGVQPGPGGGSISTAIEEYTLRASDGSTLAKVQIARAS